MEEKMNLERVIVSFVDDKPMIYGFLVFTSSSYGMSSLNLSQMILCRKHF